MTHIAAAVPAAPAPKAADKPHNATADKDTTDANGGAASAASAFHHMLQGVARAPLPSEGAAAAAGAALAAGDDGALLADMPVLLSIDALVGQTARLDAQADLALRNGTVQDAAGAAGTLLGGSLPAPLSALALGAGAGVTTVAAGVADVGATLQAAVALDAGKAQLQQALGDAAAALQGSDSAGDDALLAEGRMVLSGDWQLAADTTPTPALQRVMGHIEQWAAAAAGLQPKGRAQEGGTPGVPAGTEASALSAASSSGTRLMEQAVREAVQAEHTGAPEGPEQPPTEDMRFWLQGRQQRAQVVLNHGDQQVRVQVAVQGQQAQVIFASDAEATRAQLDAQIEQLRAQLLEQGVELVGVQVQADSGGGAAGDGARQEQALGAWSMPGARQAQVAVPVDAARAAARTAAGGLDLYV